MPGRRDALGTALAAEGVTHDPDTLVPALAGRSLAEAAREALRVATDPALPVDESLLDLLVLRAERHLATSMAGGASPTISAEAASWLAAAAPSGLRLVLRADSARREVERVLGAVGLLDLFAIVRCADDRGRAFDLGVSGAGAIAQAAEASTLERSWHAIDARLRAVGVAPAERLACEPHARASAVAARHAVVRPDGTLPDPASLRA
jgi:hypothetical protein